MMTLRIGKRFRCFGLQNGIGLIEVLVSVAILSAGLTAIYAPLLSALSAIQYADYRLDANRLISNHLWEIEMGLKKAEGERAKLREESGTWTEGVRFIRYLAKPRAVEGRRNLTELMISAVWVMGGQTKEFSRSVYLQTSGGEGKASDEK